MVPHTHWDREWYHPAARLQLRLARLVDELAARLPDQPDIPSFLLDGQAVVLDDYAALRDDGAETLRRLLGARRLEAGPWYVLPDELLVSAEALVRNLLLGMRTVRRFGGQPMRVGYAPDAFGHTGALPTILAGFGLDVALVWRGWGGESGQDGDLYRWRGPDGTEVLMVHLPAPGYEAGANLPADPAAAAARWAALSALLEPRARSPYWLVLNGADHHALQPDLPQAVAALCRAAPEATIRLARLEDHADAVRAWAHHHGGSLPVVTGELREGRAHAWSLQGTHGSRLYLKQANSHAQRLLERVVEPLCAHALVRGADLREDLRAAWRALLENHAHDSICGTSHDAVHREMMTRFARALDLGQELSERAMDAAIGHDADAARAAGQGRWQATLQVFNPNPTPWTGCAVLDVPAFLHDVPVGRAPGAEPGERRPPPLALIGADGAPLAVQELTSWPGHDLVESPRHYPAAAAVLWRRVAVRVTDLPPLGIVPLREATEPRRGIVGPPAAVEADDIHLHNAQVSVMADDDGTFGMWRRDTVDRLEGLGRLVIEDDAGDSYTSSPRGARPLHRAGAVRWDVRHPGPLWGELGGRRVRRAAKRAIEVETDLALDADSRAVVVTWRGVSRARDFRLRALFPLGEPALRVLAEGHFGPVERAVARPVSRSVRRVRELEAPIPTAPTQGWVTVIGATRALTVLCDGLPQYEARANGELLVTLLRGFGELSRGDLPERPGHAGWPTPTPDAQCRGPFRASVQLILHDPDEGSCRRAAAELGELPAYAWPRRAMLAVPPVVAGPRLEGEGLMLSALKPAEDGGAVVMRCYNMRGEVVPGAWVIPWPVMGAERCRLDETPLGPLAVEPGGRIPFEAGPREVVTILVR